MKLFCCVRAACCVSWLDSCRLDLAADKLPVYVRAATGGQNAREAWRLLPLTGPASACSERKLKAAIANEVCWLDEASAQSVHFILACCWSS